MQPEKEADKAVPDSSVRRHTSVARFWEELPGIVVALEKMATTQDVKTKLEGEYTRLLNVPGTKFLVELGVTKRLDAALRAVTDHRIGLIRRVTHGSAQS